MQFHMDSIFGCEDYYGNSLPYTTDAYDVDTAALAMFDDLMRTDELRDEFMPTALEDTSNLSSEDASSFSSSCDQANQSTVTTNDNPHQHKQQFSNQLQNMMQQPLRGVGSDGGVGQVLRCDSGSGSLTNSCGSQQSGNLQVMFIPTESLLQFNNIRVINVGHNPMMLFQPDQGSQQQSLYGPRVCSKEERQKKLQRYREKRKTRKFEASQIRYPLRKLNADRRPRVKGRFVKQPNLKQSKTDTTTTDYTADTTPDIMILQPEDIPTIQPIELHSDAYV